MWKKSLILQNKLEELPRLTQSLETFLLDYHVPENEILIIVLVMEELFVNQVSYGYHDDKNHVIDIEIALDESEQEIIITMVNDGDEFNFLDMPDPNIHLSVEERPIGGLGIFFIKQKMDFITYQRTENKNRITLKKKIAIK